mmetsp:Transcript_27549/g.66998  ORF Transcript_27549/g.66998 Transcript_27549/m.66998 type:complete len:255 (-) Transcript_27549:1146-1910(-)
MRGGTKETKAGHHQDHDLDALHGPDGDARHARKPRQRGEGEGGGKEEEGSRGEQDRGAARVHREGRHRPVPEGRAGARPRVQGRERERAGGGPPPRRVRPERRHAAPRVRAELRAEPGGLLRVRGHGLPHPHEGGEPARHARHQGAGPDDRVPELLGDRLLPDLGHPEGGRPLHRLQGGVRRAVEEALPGPAQGRRRRPFLRGERPRGVRPLGRRAHRDFHRCPVQGDASGGPHPPERYSGGHHHRQYQHHGNG